MPLSPSLPHCTRWRYRLDPPYCGKFYCPIHGWDTRHKRALQHIRSLSPEDRITTNVLHLNKRCHGYEVGRVAQLLRASFSRRFPEAYLLVFPHVYGSLPPLQPVPHLHLLATTRGETLDGTALDLWGREAALDAKGSFLESPGTLSDADIKAWEMARSREALLLYLYQATEAHRHLPADRLPPRGLSYHQRYGRVRRRVTP